MAAQSVAACLQMKCRTINELECWSQSFGLLKDKWMHVFPNRIILLRSILSSTAYLVGKFNALAIVEVNEEQMK